MASTPSLGETPAKQNCSIKSHRGKQPQWKDVDTMAATMATVRLPDASINGSKQKKSDWHAQLKKEFDRLLGVLIPEHPELNNRQRMDVWKARSGRGVAEQRQKGLALCRKLKGCLRVVQAQQTTGNATDEDKMRCAVGLLNNVIKTSHFYDVFRNPSYVIGKAFPYPKIFDWLSNDTSELDPVPLTVDHSTETVSQRMDTPVEGEQAACNVNGAVQSGVDRGSLDEGFEGQRESRKRPLGVKTAKAAKRAKREAAAEDVALKTALDSWTKGFADASSASIDAANTRAMMDREHSHREYVLKKEADELEAVKVLFNDEDEESRQYRRALKRKRLRKLLREEGIEGQSTNANVNRAMDNRDHADTSVNP